MAPELTERRPRTLQITLIIGAIFIVALAVYWFTPSGSGESQTSPDGRWQASAMNMERGTLLRRRVKYIELTVKDKQTGRILWTLRLDHPERANIPTYAERSKKCVSWGPNSDFVVFDFLGGIPVTLPVK